MDLSDMRILCGDATEAAVTVLRETVRERTDLDVPLLASAAGGAEDRAGRDRTKDSSGRGRATTLRLTVGTPVSEAARRLSEPGAEGYRIATVPSSGSTPTGDNRGAGAATADTRGRREPGEIEICGADSRGLLYGVGRFLRKVDLRKGSVILDAPLTQSETPVYPLRGHQLGYRPKTNAYDAWSKEQYRRYIMDLAMFGANSIEIMPPRTDDEARSPVMKYDAVEMMAWLSQTIHSFGLEVWIWYPNMGGGSYGDRSVREAERAERREIFSACPFIDHVFVPGGDPGDLEPDELFDWAGEVSDLLHRHHDSADIWLSPQAFRLSTEWLEAFYRNVGSRPDWLGGVVYAPWERDDLPTLRARVPDDVPIRRYPDITHSLNCQYPVPNWDTTFAVTLGRECYNPRPRAFKSIHNRFAELACGSISYSEGINDDINKFVWSDQDWDPTTPVEQTLRDFARLFVSADVATEFAECVMSLETHWDGPIEANDLIPVTAHRLQRMEADYPDVLDDYRFTMASLRSLFDAYQQQRRIQGLAAERRARVVLACSTSGDRVNEALRAFDGAVDGESELARLRDHCVRRADELFEKIGWQTSVHRHGGQAVRRGAFLDAIDAPLGERSTLEADLRRLAQSEPTEPEEASEIDRMLGAPPTGARVLEFTPDVAAAVVDAYEREDDPAHHHGALLSFAVPPEYAQPAEWQGLTPRPREQIRTDKWSEIRHVRTYYSTPLTITVTGLSPNREYTLVVTYVGSAWGTVCSIKAGEQTIVERLELPRGPAQLSHPIPADAVLSNGRLVLSWQAFDGAHGPGIVRLQVE